ncbi:hypothetical protein THRCLA_09786, partial [Thraustotheca clavata]
MQRIQKVVSLVVAMTSAVNAAACPYSAYTSTFTVDYCNSTEAIICVVDNTCEPKAMFTENDITKDATQTKLLSIKCKAIINAVIYNNMSTIDPAEYLAQLPKVTNTYVQFYNSVRKVGNLSSATSVSLIDFEGTTGIDLSAAVFPYATTRVYVDIFSILFDCENSSIANCALTTMPTTIPYGQLSEFYGWQNKFTAVQDIDFRKAIEICSYKVKAYIILVNSTIAHSSQLFQTYRYRPELVNCGYFDSSKFTTFTIDPTTYAALQNVATFSVGGIDVSSSCNAPNKKMPLQSYTVCVTPAKYANSIETSKSSSSNVGLIVGVSVGTTNTGMGINLEELELLRLDEQALTRVQSVAQGAFGEVWRGEYKGTTMPAETQIYHYTLGQIVAIKCMLP